MTFFGYCKYEQKTLKFAWQHFEIQSSLCVKKNLIQRLYEKDWIKSMYIK
jgi:hypothetical protein